MGSTLMTLPAVTASWILIGLICRSADSAKVLFFNGIGEGSHFTSTIPFAEALVERGISVTYLVGEAYRYRREHQRHRELFQFEIFPSRASRGDVEGRPGGLVLSVLEGKPQTEFLKHVMDMRRRLTEDCEDLFQSKTLQRLKLGEYDLVVYDAVRPCSALLAEYLNVTKVLYMNPALYAGYVRLTGNPMNPATVAEVGRGAPVRMNFLRRVVNVLGIAFHRVMFLRRKPYDSIRDRFEIKNGWLRSLETTSLVLPSSDPFIDQKIPTMHHVKMVGGGSTRPSKPLPEDLEDFMQSSGDHGVILFILGSYVTHFPEGFVKTFQEAFQRLPQKVIWQWKSVDPPKDMPDNVKTMEWLPVNDLLGHDKTRLMLYQGGNGALYEAIYHAVPLIVIPILGDQSDVAQRVLEAGVGRVLDISQVTSDIIAEAATTVLTDPRYKTNMDRISAIFRDQPQHPSDKGAFWIEYIIRHGPESLRSSVHNLSFIQLHLIDVGLYLTIHFFLIVYAVFRGFKYVCGTKNSAR